MHGAAEQPKVEAMSPVTMILRALPLRCRRGVTALEYGLIAGLIAVALITGAGKLGSTMNNDFVQGAAFIGYIDQ